MSGKRSYEDFAEVAFGSKHWRTVVSIAMMISLLGFTTAYISLSKTLIPSIVEVSVSTERYETLPTWLQNNELSRKVWATIFRIRNSALPLNYNIYRCAKTHFGENQLAPSSIGISPLTTIHPLIFQHQSVRSST